MRTRQWVVTTAFVVETRVLKRVGAALAWPAATVLAVAVAVAMATVAACQTDAETARANAEVRRAEWTRQIHSLGEMETTLRGRLGRIPAAPSGGDGVPDVRAQASRLRAEAVLAGSRQSLFDLEASITKGSAALGENVGGPAQAAALEEEQARVLEVLKMLREQLASTEREIVRLGKS